MALRLITPPANQPITLDQAKAHLRVVDSDDDVLIASLLAAATKHAEEFMGRALIDQVWELVLDAFPEDTDIRIPKPPLIEVVGLFYFDANGDEQQISTGDYTVDTVSEPGWVIIDGDWPATFDGVNSVRIRYRAGYVAFGSSPPEDAVPDDIIAAIKLHLGALYAHRETTVVGQTAVELPWGAEQLLRMHRVEISMA